MEEVVVRASKEVTEEIGQVWEVMVEMKRGSRFHRWWR